MRAPFRWLAVCAFVSSAVPAAADDGDPPAIPVRELPPFPDVDEGADAMSEIGVYGANLAEEETVVGAAKREQSLGTVASAVTVLTSDTIRRYGYRTLAEALRSVAGVYVTDDRNIERVGIRGIQPLGDANTRVLILIDGTPFNEPWSQFVDSSTALPISLDDVARIEVIRGPVSSIYGTNAFIGIINIVTLEADKAPRAHGRTTVDTDGTFGANAAFNTGDINRQVRGSVSYQYRVGETVAYDAFPMPETDADGANALFGSLSVTFDRLFFQARAYQRERQLPGAPYESDIGSEGNSDQHQHVVAEVGYTRDVTDRITLAGRLYANRYAYEGRLSYVDREDPMNEIPDAYVTTASSLWYGGEVRALADVLPTRDLLSVTTGASIELSSTESDATTLVDPIEKDFNIAGVYLEGTTQPVKWFALTAGARYDRNSEFTNELSPRAAVFLRRGEDYGLKFLYARGFRNPSIFEGYYDDDLRFDPSFGGDGRTVLRPEKIQSYEVVAYGKLATGIKGRISLWDWTLDDVIQREGIFDQDTNQRRIRYQNRAQVFSRGVELESTYRDVAGRSAYASVAIVKTASNCVEDTSVVANPLLDLETGNCSPQENAPQVLAKAGASSQLLADVFHLSGEVSYTSARITQDRMTEIDPYVGLNVVAYAPDVRGFDITVGARNLLGREDVPAQVDYNRLDPADIDVLRVPGPGREIFTRVGYRF